MFVFRCKILIVPKSVLERDNHGRKERKEKEHISQAN